MSAKAQAKTLTVPLTGGAITMLKTMLADAGWYARKGKDIVYGAIDLNEGPLSEISAVPPGDEEGSDRKHDVVMEVRMYNAAKACCEAFLRDGNLSLTKHTRCLISEFEAEF